MVCDGACDGKSDSILWAKIVEPACFVAAGGAYGIEGSSALSGRMFFAPARRRAEPIIHAKNPATPIAIRDPCWMAELASSSGAAVRGIGECSNAHSSASNPQSILK